MDIVFLASSITLLQLGNLFDESKSLVNIVALLVFWVFICKNSLLFLKAQLVKSRSGYLSDNSRLNMPVAVSYGIFISFFFIAIYRSYANGVFETLDISFYFFGKWVTIILMVISMFMIPRSVVESRRLKASIFLSIWIYILVNVAMYLIGVRALDTKLQDLFGFSESIGTVGTLEMIGIEAERVVFPMADGIGSFANAAGLSIVSAAAMLDVRGGKLKSLLLPFIVILISTFAVIMTDSRSTIISSFIIVFAYFTLRLSLFHKFFPLLPYVSVSLLLSTLIIVTLTIIYPLDESFGFLARNSTQDVLSNRKFIWLAGFADLNNFSISHLVGFGIYGQVSSGISRIYSIISSARLSSAETTSLHNFFLQSIYDTGYLGLTAYIAVFFIAIKCLSNQPEFSKNKLSIAMILSLNYLSLAGFSEVIPTVYNQEIFFLFNMFIASNLLITDVT
jgi:hypothetical protein